MMKTGKSILGWFLGRLNGSPLGKQNFGHMFAFGIHRCDHLCWQEGGGLSTGPQFSQSLLKVALGSCHARIIVRGKE